MESDELLERVRDMRARSLSPKEIARALGLRPAKVKPLIKAVAAAEETDPAKRAVVECLVNAGWHDGLTVTGHPEWLDESDAAPTGGGLASVLVARDAGRGRVSVCCYLVDVYCLGVKNTLGPRVLDQHALPGFVRSYFDAYERRPIPVPFELAQHLVLGAVDYARGLGFEPPAESDFDATRDHLGEWAGPSVIRFGKDGEPFYISGPYDNPDRVMRTLERSVGKGNFHFMTSAPL